MPFGRLGSRLVALVEVKELSADLLPQATTTLQFPMRRVPRDLADQIAADLVRGGSRSGNAPTESAVRNALRLPEIWPPVTGVVVGHDRVVWIRSILSGKGTRQWYRIDTAAGAVHGIELPEKEEIAASDKTSVIVVGRDSLDVPFLVRYVTR